MDHDAYDLEAQLLPERIRLDLARIGAVLAADQLLASQIIDRLNNFRNPLRPLSLDRYRRRPDAWEEQLEESLGWLVEEQVLEPGDTAVVRQLRNHASELMADIPSHLLNLGRTVQIDLFEQVIAVSGKLTRFWGRIEVDSDPAFR